MANPGFLERPARRERIIGLVVDGLTDNDIAKVISTKRISVSQPAITQFRQRHVAAIEAKKAEAVQAVKDEWIADKQERIKRLAGLYQDVEDWQTENGISEVTISYDKDGAERGRTLKLNAALVNAKRGILSDVSDQLGQTPRPDQNLNIKAQVLVRQYVGFDPLQA